MNTGAMTTAGVATIARHHNWAATGVSDYPPQDPLVGQGLFFERYKTFIHTVDRDEDKFAHVFAIEGEWGRGKSRLGHELIAQINECSQGWFVRDSKTGQLNDAQLFNKEEDRDGYLGLYIRYSQVASEFQNANNWFGFGVYKALLPLATETFDDSIQGGIAKQAFNRYRGFGFDSAQLAQALELDKKHSTQALYEEPGLLTRLVNQAFEYLEKFGIKHVLLVLDELETIAEAASFGLEDDDTKRLDGQAIRLIGRAIKEEDHRRNFPWLRYVALCSPLLGQQMREVKSNARRFELVQLEHNAFADVSDYVKRLNADRKLRHTYPAGLVEAAYTMSGANFGWFNVIMSNVDVVLDELTNAGQPVPPNGELFDILIRKSGRVSEHVLDHHAIDGINTLNRDLLAEARTLLFGQLPVALEGCSALTKALLDHQNEDNEPVASLYRKVKWDPLECRQALKEYKFIRDKEEWSYPSIEQPLSLNALLQNLQTFAINETEEDSLLIPLSLGEFRHLINLLYNHPAAEYAAEALWRKFFGDDKELSEAFATHIGPSIAMLLKLDLRYRSQQSNSMIFLDTEHADTHSQGVTAWEAALPKEPLLRNITRLTGIYRLLDNNWGYQPVVYSNASDLAIIQPARGGLQSCEGLRLHPNNQVWFAWVNNNDELNSLHREVTAQRASGRLPVMAFTTSIGVFDFYRKGTATSTQNDILLYQLNTSETDTFELIGLPQQYSLGLDLKNNLFNAKFKGRLNNLKDHAYQAIHQWRKSLNEQGLIAWPLRPSGKLNPQKRDELFKAWKLLGIDQPGTGLASLTSEHSVDAVEIANLLSDLSVPGSVTSKGYDKTEHAGLFSDVDNPNHALAQLPPFLASITNPAKDHAWTFSQAKMNWYWGYLWDNANNPKSVFEDWMWWAAQLNLLEVKPEHRIGNDPKWTGVPRASFENVITEARNWLDDDQPGHYRETVEQLKKVYGQERINGLFAPSGPKTTNAVTALDRAQITFDRLKQAEEKLDITIDLDDLARAMVSCIKDRNDVLAQVDRVKPADSYKPGHQNFNTIDLGNDDIPLYNRIEQAREFAEIVNNCGEKISSRVSQLVEDLREDPEAQVPFPQNLFTLSLQTITHILEGALDRNMESATAKREAGGSSETLLHYLRDLKIDKAYNRLQLLGHEVGYNLSNNSLCAPDDISGHIMTTFKRFKTSFKKLLEQFDGYKKGVERCKQQLEMLPADYEDKNVLNILTDLEDQLTFIGDAFEDIVDNVESERQRFSEQSCKGQFSSIKDIPERLVSPVQKQLNAFAGHLLTIQNQIKGYQKEKLDAANGELMETLNPLFKVCGQPEMPVLQQHEISHQTLHDLGLTLEAREAKWSREAEKLLEPTGINLQRWIEIAKALNAEQEPDLTSDERQALEKAGIIRYRTTYGG
ncbi:hypothetical protein [Endozoicomonas sp. 2B-B]